MVMLQLGIGVSAVELVQRVLPGPELLQLSGSCVYRSRRLLVAKKLDSPSGEGPFLSHISCRIIPLHLHLSIHSSASFPRKPAFQISDILKQCWLATLPCLDWN